MTSTLLPVSVTISQSSNPSTVKFIISWYSSTGCTCYLHRCISYFDSPAGSEVNIQLISNSKESQFSSGTSKFEKIQLATLSLSLSLSLTHTHTHTHIHTHAHTHKHKLTHPIINCIWLTMNGLLDFEENEDWRISINSSTKR